MRGAEFVLCLFFGITGSVCSLFLRFGRRILLKALANHPLAAIRMPSHDDVMQYQQAFKAR